MGLVNVLVFPAEGMNALELHDALSTCVNIKLFGATSVERHAKYVFKNLITDVPNIGNQDFIEKFNTIIKENNIDLIFPTHDTVALYLVEHAKCIKAKVISGDLKTVEVCRSKAKTYSLFRGESFIPIQYLNSEKLSFPLFMKPDDGQGAVGARLIETFEDLDGIDWDSYVLTEYLPGKEYTVDCFTDFKGNLRYISPRSRSRLMAGISVAGESVEVVPEVEYIAKTINSRLNFLGLWYFQLKEDKDGHLKLLEISSRCAGTMCQTRAKGINLPLLSVYTALGNDVTIFDNKYKVQMDRALIGRYFIDYYYETVYIDFDDTITLNKGVNLNVVKFLYQCKNFGKSVILLTRHANDIDESLSQYALSKNLFDKIIHINNEDLKSKYIDPNNAIFIDNAYKEREDVAKVHSIPVFDVDGIEFLLDWRI